MVKDLSISIRSFSETDPGIRDLLKKEPEAIIRVEGTCYLLAGDKVYSCSDHPEGNSLLKMIKTGVSQKDPADEEDRALRDAIRGKVDTALFQKLGLKEHTKRCIILFRLSQPENGDQLRELIPLERSDKLTVLGNGDAVLLIHMDRKTQDEVLEFASAAAETLESEAGITCFAGVGRPVDSMESISASFADAESALSTGLRHRKPGRVFAYGSYTLDRFIDLIPAQEAEKLRREILPDESEKVLNAETLETVRVFFENDLNLSTTARQLFIHRNTLIYRIEKIRKITGLDLKRFEDAAVFRIMMGIPEKQA